MKKLKIIRATTVPISFEFFEGTMGKLLEGNDVHYLSSPGTELDAVAKKYHIKVHSVEMYRRLSPLKDLKSLYQLIKVFIKEKPDMVHSMTPKAGLLCMMAAYLTRVPVRVHTFTGLVWPIETGFKRKLLMLTDKITCFCATHIIPEGDGVKMDLLNHGITKKPLKVLGYGNVKGVDMEYYSSRDEVRSKMEELKLRDESKFTFLFVGRIVRDKGINELCKAYMRIHSQYPNTRCWLVGNYEDSLDPISQESRRMIEQGDNGLISVGPKLGDELLAYYAAADCFVFPSYREGFPNTVLEAGAMGLPSIVTDINGSREIITEGENGYVIPSKDADALYEAMCRMINNNVERNTMAAKARKMIGDRFEQSFVRQCLYDFYDEILAHLDSGK